MAVFSGCSVSGSRIALIVGWRTMVGGSAVHMATTGEVPIGSADIGSRWVMIRPLPDETMVSLFRRNAVIEGFES